MARALADAGPSRGSRDLVARAARWSHLNIRLTVLITVVLIGGSFAAAATLQMRLDRIHALDQASQYEARRATDIAAVVAASLDRFAASGRAFADGPETPDVLTPGVRNVAIFNRAGIWIDVLRGTARDFPDVPESLVAGAARTAQIAPPSLLAFSHRDKTVVVYFDPHALVPPALLDRAALIANGVALTHGAGWTNGTALSARSGIWPIAASVSLDQDAALNAWTGSLPLYLFVILGPALVGGFLAALFVGEFERRARASQAVRALRSTRPLEANLLVRLAQAERRAAESTRSKAEFIANMSHELRTPLNAIIGFAEVIHQQIFGGAGQHKYQEYAHDIAVAGRQLHQRIGEVLEYANADAGRYPLKAERLELAELAQELVNEHAGRAFSRRISLSLGHVVPVAAIGDAHATKRTLSILIANALSYSPEGSAVRLDVRDDEGAAVLSVRDTGIGFTENERSMIGQGFVRFRRSGVSSGAGLGLAIATALARGMGGALNIGGTRGTGTVAELRLPKFKIVSSARR